MAQGPLALNIPLTLCSWLRICVKGSPTGRRRLVAIDTTRAVPPIVPSMPTPWAPNPGPPVVPGEVADAPAPAPCAAPDVTVHPEEGLS